MGVKAIRPGDRVTLNYRLSSMGQEIVNTFPDGPETFVLGTGEIDPRLEFLLTGLVAGDCRSWQLEPRQAFGARDESMVYPLPRGDFPADAEIEPGNVAEFNLPNGQTWSGTIVVAEGDEVRVDFNHPLAGVPVEFEVEIIAVE
jgi:FKBP-type peptidyl-prolyl cis-trans isomerase SlpA